MLLENRTGQIEWLVAEGRSVHVCDHLGRNALHAMLDRPDFVGCCGSSDFDSPALYALPKLVAAGLNLDEPDGDGRTPLMLAAKHGRIKTFRYLLDAGADPYVIDHRGRTALTFGAGRDTNSQEIVKRLTDIGLQIGITEAIYTRNDFLDISDLIQSDLSIEIPDGYGWTPLAIYCKCGWDEGVRLLLQRGADVNALADENYTPLMAAPAGTSWYPIPKTWREFHSARPYEPRVKIVEMLLDAKAEVNPAPHEICGSPLDHAVAGKNVEAAKLIESGGGSHATTRYSEEPKVGWAYWRSERGEKSPEEIEFIKQWQLRQEAIARGEHVIETPKKKNKWRLW